MVKVLKIGGSIITDKNRRLFARSEEINRVAEEVAPFAENLILIHGAGSFGHVLADEYNLRGKFDPEGLRVTHSSVVDLNRLVVEALARYGANPMPVHPFSCTILRDGRIESFSLKPIERMIQEGLLPVLHGDVAMDITQRAGIVSGDDLVPYLARSLDAEIVAEGTDKDGVLVDGMPLKEISRDDWTVVEKHLGGSSTMDVTGGMREKVLKLLELADAGINSMIFNASKRGNISRVLKGDVLGTEVN